MTDFIHLIGAEDVQRAASSMRGAAETMRQTASSMDGSLNQHHIFMDDWLYRLEEVLKDCLSTLRGSKIE